MTPGQATLQALPHEARPREKLLARGPGALSDAELLALLLRTGLPGKNVLLLAQELVDRFGGVAGLLHTPADALKSIKGLGPAKRAELVAVLELARRALSEQLRQQPVAGVHGHLDGQQRPLALERQQRLREAARRRRHDAAHGQPPRAAFAQFLQLAVQRLHAAAQVAEVARHALAGGVQLQAAAHALEQRQAQRAFQLMQHLGGRRLAQAQPGCSAAQRPLLLYGQHQRHLPHAQAVEQLRRAVPAVDGAHSNIP